MGRCRGTFVIFFGVKHRMRKEEMEEQFNKEARKGGYLHLMQQTSQIRMQTKRTVSTLRAESLWPSTVTWEQLLGKEREEVCRSFLCTAGTQKDGPRETRPCFEAVVKRARAIRRPWLNARDANLSPEDFEKSMWFQSMQMVTEAPKEASTCRSKGPDSEFIERAYDYVTASQSLKGKLTQMVVVEDLESRPHRAVSFVVEREKEVQEWNEQKMLKALPGFIGGRLPGRSTEERGREEQEEAEESREVRGL